jgi:citrate synthase
MTNSDYIPGLEGVVAAQTSKSMVDGLAGKLVIGGFPLERIALNASFEEMVFLLWNDHLPNQKELNSFQQSLAELRELPKATMSLLEEISNSDLDMMDALRIGAGTLGTESPENDSDSWNARRLVAAFPTLVSAAWRFSQGKKPIAPDPKLGHAANYLYMIEGKIPSESRSRGLETYLNTVIDHGLNASTFTARVIVSTESDFISAIVGAVGALKGPLHGGAPGPALDMVFDIGRADKAEAYLRTKIEAGERLMGFGHRVYKVRDPRAEVLSEAARMLFENDGDTQLYDLVKSVERQAVALLEEYKPGRNLYTNVEFYTALLLHGLDLSIPMFSPTFAVGRVAGWLAHCFEQRERGRLIRPKAEYDGERDRQYIELDKR